MKAFAPQLNDRQRAYLLAAYQLDQSLEAQHKHDYHRGVRSPASDWRLMPYGRWQHLIGKPPTQLRGLIEEEQKTTQRRLVDPGTGSTWKALAERGLVEVEERVIIQDPRDGYSLPHIALTREGRKLVRQFTGEVRPPVPRKVKPTPAQGLLTNREWRAFAIVYSRDLEGLAVDDTKSPYFIHAEINYNTFSLLRSRGLLIGSPDDNALHVEKYTITEQGREFYSRYYRVNAQAHASTGHADLPRPMLTPEQRTFWQQLGELNRKRSCAGPVQTDIDAVRREILALQIAATVGALLWDDSWYMTLAGKAIAINTHELPEQCPFATETAALERVREKVERWKQQVTWLEPAC